MMKRKAGFSMIELLIVLAITAILMTLAYPNYQSYILRSHRTEGTATLMAIQLAEEKYRLNNNTYGALDQVWDGVATSQQGYYTLMIAHNTATDYLLTATAVGSQAKDAQGDISCRVLTVSMNDGIVTKAPAACW